MGVAPVKRWGLSRRGPELQLGMAARGAHGTCWRKEVAVEWVLPAWGRSAECGLPSRASLPALLPQPRGQRV